jgi:beta-barrel assembly-enhancing protease
MIRPRFSLWVVALALTGCATLDSMVSKTSDMAVSSGAMSADHAASIKKTSSAFRSSAADISESEEYYIGRAVSAQILARYKPYDDDDLHAYLQSVLQIVAMSSDRPVTFKGYHIQVLDTDEINALSAPSGFVFITTGLLKQVENEDQLGCVLAHEVAHVALKHGLKTIKASRLTSAFATLGTEAAKTYTSDQVSQLTTAFQGSINDIVNNLVVNGYSRGKELEADKSGDNYAAQALYDPGALIKFLTKLEAQETAGAGGLMKTHPKPEDRIAALQKLGLAPAAGYQTAPPRTQRFNAIAQNL